MTHGTLDPSGQDLLFRQARTHNGWQDRPVSDETLRELYDLLKWGPTSANCSPMRVLFLRSTAAKEKLAPAMAANNRAKTLAAPVTALIGYDLKFYELLPELFPHNPTARSWFEGQPHAEETAFRSGTLQGAYLMLAARAVGLDCGPMSGFDAGLVNSTFWADGTVKINFICNLGYGDPAALYARGPRLDFDRVCTIL